MLSKADKQYLEERFVTNEKLDNRFAIFETKMEVKFATKDELESGFSKLDSKLNRVINMLDRETGLKQKLDQEHTLLQAKQSEHEDRISKIENHLRLASE